MLSIEQNKRTLIKIYTKVQDKYTANHLLLRLLEQVKKALC